jgi:hypothetical protein
MSIERVLRVSLLRFFDVAVKCKVVSRHGIRSMRNDIVSTVLADRCPSYRRTFIALYSLRGGSHGTRGQDFGNLGPGHEASSPSRRAAKPPKKKFLLTPTPP